ncbi:MAG: phosphonate metabolism transcriptional regulator PhnF [Hyphomicrobiales bacterium]|nr:phosphonate metabolism transcriptional regulator PhnF [Hyphomicrobiales bacterium]MBV8823418.1 phosphonate metabolism transcriptional regulator PhnF [Hyphomicrobiales bacterium]MBV9426201.1 phosphonate metabolism transcriptional regulator PhnF [Bradyrhizobiaceae bacterium]
MARAREKPVTARPPAAGVTLWRRIADDLERAIAAGDIAAGEKLPGETEIAARFGVNRHTVRRAIAELAGRGLVRAARGSGTFVEGGRLAYPISARTRFSEIVGTAGREAGGRLVASRLEPADGAIARRLKIPKGTPVVRLDFVRSANGVPLSAGTTWLPAARAPDAAKIYEATGSITRVLAAAGISDYRRYSTRVTAAVADAIDAARLDLSPGRPLLVVESVDVTPDGKPITTSTGRFAADRVELMVEN